MCVADVEFRDATTQRFGDSMGCLLGRVRQQNDKFLAPKAPHDVGLPDPVLQRSGYFSKDAVSRIVPVRVVEPLEMINPDHQDRERDFRHILLSRTREYGVLHDLLEMAPVV